MILPNTLFCSIFRFFYSLRLILISKPKKNKKTTAIIEQDREERMYFNLTRKSFNGTSNEQNKKIKYDVNANLTIFAYYFSKNSTITEKK